MSMLVNPFVFGAGGGPDPHFASVVLLAHFDGANGSTVFTDEKGHALSALGNAQITTATSVFGGASLLLDGITDNVNSPDHADWHLGSGDWTIELFANYNTITSDKHLISQYVATGNQRSWFFVRRNTAGGAKLEFVYSTNGSTTNTAAEGSFTPTLDTWYYHAIKRFGSTVSIYSALATDPTTTLIGSGSAGADAFFDSTSALRIGGINSSGTELSFDGRIDEVRITKGVARDVSAVPTVAFPNS